MPFLGLLGPAPPLLSTDHCTSVFSQRGLYNTTHVNHKAQFEPEGSRSKHSSIRCNRCPAVLPIPPCFPEDGSATPPSSERACCSVRSPSPPLRKLWSIHGRVRHLLLPSDIYSYGIVLLELWTGRLQNSKDTSGEAFTFEEEYIHEERDIY